MGRPALPLLMAAMATVLACGGSAVPPTPTPDRASIELSTPVALTRSDLTALAAAFSDAPFAGGQVAPFVAKWASDTTFVFVQFDRPRAADASGVAYLGVGEKGTFCSESQPDRASGGFAVFHRAVSPGWTSGSGGRAGDDGYWLSYLAVDRLRAAGRTVTLGIDYAMPGPRPPSCGSARPATFAAPGAGKMTPDAIGRIFSVFTENPLQGGQVPPRMYRALNDRVLAFVQFDHNSADKATDLRYIGIVEKSKFCASTQPTRDFTHFHDLVAPVYAQGHGGAPGTIGFWGTWVAAVPFESQGRQVSPGVDREFSPTPAPSSC
jgi:hypothetical protein